MKKHKITMGFLAAALAATTLMASGCGRVRLGYIDGDRIMKEAPQIKSISDEGNQKLQEVVSEAHQSLQNGGNTSPEDAQKAQADAQRKMAGIQQSYQLQIQQKMDAASAAVVKEKKLDAILDSHKEAPTAVTGCVDVTDAVISKLQ